MGAAGHARRAPPPRSTHAAAEGTSTSAVAGTSARACRRRRIRVGNGVRCGRGSSHRSSDPEDHARAGWRLPGWDHGRSGERLVRRPRPSRARPSRPANASAGREADSSRRCTGMAGAGHPLPVRRRCSSRDRQPDRCALGEGGRPADPRRPTRQGCAWSRSRARRRFRLGEQLRLEHACASERVFDDLCATSRHRKQWPDDCREHTRATARRQGRRPHSARARRRRRLSEAGP